MYSVEIYLKFLSGNLSLPVSVSGAFLDTGRIF
jgi:hypothetical protein